MRKFMIAFLVAITLIGSPSVFAFNQLVNTTALSRTASNGGTTTTAATTDQTTSNALVVVEVVLSVIGI